MLVNRGLWVVLYGNKFLTCYPIINKPYLFGEICLNEPRCVDIFVHAVHTRN